MLSDLNPYRAPVTFCIHLAIAVIIAGAFVSHFRGIEGKLHLVAGRLPTTEFEKVTGPGDGHFPFAIELVEPVIYYYPGTTTPMDYASRLRISEGDIVLSESVTAMNKVFSFRGWRFFQSGISDSSSTLLVSYDPVGTGVTYTGYALMIISMLLFFFQKKTLWRVLSRRITALIIMSAVTVPVFASGALRSVQRPLARNMGKMYVMWNGRICPVQTMARDIAIKLYGTDTYKGFTAEQILAGWLFNYDKWIKDLELSGAEEEKINLARWIGSGSALRIYPYKTASGTVEWLSLCERRPSKMGLEQWVFMQTSMPKVASFIASGQNIEADSMLTVIIEGQRRYAPAGLLPSGCSMRLERIFNTYIRLKPVAFILLALSLCGIFVSVSPVINTGKRNTGQILLTGLSMAAFLYVGTALFIRSYVGGHLPFGNGHETMLSLTLVALAASFFIPAPDMLLKSSSVLVAALALLVAVMSEKNPQIAHLTPVLSSTWLSVHVMLVILSYAAFAVMAVLSAVSLIVHDKAVTYRCVAINRAVLVPAVFLLGAGIMAGAVWANQTWGRYWGWIRKRHALSLRCLYTRCRFTAPL